MARLGAAQTQTLHATQFSTGVPAAISLWMAEVRVRSSRLRQSSFQFCG